MQPEAEYDARFLEGVLLFNEEEYFEAHEVWEDLWHDTAGSDRLFFQALIQAAVALHHLRNGNRVGALRLFERGKAKMQTYGLYHMGLDIARFWNQMTNRMTSEIASLQPIPNPKIVLAPSS